MSRKGFPMDGNDLHNSSTAADETTASFLLNLKKNIQDGDLHITLNNFNFDKTGLFW